MNFALVDEAPVVLPQVVTYNHRQPVVEGPALPLSPLGSRHDTSSWPHFAHGTALDDFSGLLSNSRVSILGTRLILRRGALPRVSKGRPWLNHLPLTIV